MILLVFQDYEPTGTRKLLGMLSIDRQNEFHEITNVVNYSTMYNS